MKITKESDELVLRLPLRQKSYDAIGQYTHDTDSLIGIVAGNDYTISHLIDLGYKGDQQEGSPIIFFDTIDQLRKVCEEFDIDIWEHPLCAYCRKVIRGSFTMGDKGNKCWGCENLPQVCTQCGQRFKNELADICSACFEEA